MRPREASRLGEPDTQPAATEVKQAPPPGNASDQTTADQESEPQSVEAIDASDKTEIEDAQQGSEEQPQVLTDVPAVVVEDADVRVRPGLPWPVVDRLSAGDEVVVLNVASGWFRISYGNDGEGWIRTPALDLGEIEVWQILNEPASAIVAEWQGEPYGVMGQSADGAEVRLLPVDDDLAEIVSAPIDEVTLLADDISVHDLPILIGDETVVFPGGDFRAGQGRVLPRANEWMWLPWGWLLAHNDTHIWQWRPDTDDLQLTSRPFGRAKLSPDGQIVAIVECAEREVPCTSIRDVLLLPLDGSPRPPYAD